MTRMQPIATLDASSIDYFVSHGLELLVAVLEHPNDDIANVAAKVLQELTEDGEIEKSLQLKLVNALQETGGH